LNKLIK